METVVFGAKEVLAEKGRPVLLSSAPMIHGHLYLLPNTRVWLDGWTGCIETLVKFASSSGPCSSPTQLVVPGIYARLRLPSRFRKLLGLSFISANWMEYSWPFQWNQLTPCEKEKASRWVSTKTRCSPTAAAWLTGTKGVLSEPDHLVSHSCLLPICVLICVLRTCKGAG